MKVYNISKSLGNSLNNLKRYEEAILMYDEAIEMDPKNSSYYNNKGENI